MPMNPRHSEGLAARCQLLADLGVTAMLAATFADADAALENFIIRYRFAPTRAAIPGRACRGCVGAMRWSISNWTKPAAWTEALALAGRLNGRALNGCWAVCSAPNRAGSPPRSLAPLARFADLDGPTWLAVDVEPALQFSTGVLHL